MITKEEYLIFLNRYDFEYHKIKDVDYYISVVKLIESNYIQLNLNTRNIMIVIFNDKYSYIDDINKFPKNILKILNIEQ